MKTEDIIYGTIMAISGALILGLMNLNFWTLFALIIQRFYP